MPTITKNTDFKGDFFIPNSVVIPNKGGAPNAKSEVELFIEKYEKLLLVNSLGVIQYNALIADVSASGKWYDLKNGKEYDGKIWVGLKSITIPFIFYHYLKNDKTFYSTTGIQRPDSENSTSVNPTLSLVESWNYFVEAYQGLNHCNWYFLQPIFYFEGWDYWNNQNKSSYVSLKEYLSYFKDDYDSSFFKHYEMINRFGL